MVAIKLNCFPLSWSLKKEQSTLKVVQNGNEFNTLFNKTGHKTAEILKMLPQRGSLFN